MRILYYIDIPMYHIIFLTIPLETYLRRNIIHFALKFYYKLELLNSKHFCVV